MMTAQAPKKATSPKRFMLKLVLWMLMCLIVLLGLIMVASFSLKNTQTLVTISSAVQSLRPFLIAAHGLFLALLYWRWASLVHWVSKKGWIAPSQKPWLGTMRTRVMTLLIIFEVVLVIRPLEWL
jgi:hypothetical protein